MYSRNDTVKIRIGDIFIGDGSPIAVQSMTNTPTGDVCATSEQIIRLEEAGCDIVRVTVPDLESAQAISEIKARTHVPIVADVHFDHRLAIEAIRAGADKIRINPGNIGSSERVRAVVNAAKERGVPIRIGVNGGSLEKRILKKYGSPCAEALAESVEGHVKLLEALDFGDICISVKSSDVRKTVDAYRL
ncbi:MAG: flavodoxin-dependent (E)-4-hydroxy-3-methylbut-2-enyl-diphosphate synthase, partial [Clostridia bacterium]|nr:flavodoxin-dependent (E)-4-hydroxy-3-methylbut-2-enyl-diphosphate synthase [Clostridia bacterium]